MLVQWHLETQSKQFISRLGAPILNFSLSGPSQTYYSTLMADNSVKVVRFDNNKVKVHIQGVQLDRVSLGGKETGFLAGSFVVPHKNTLQMYSVDDRTVDSLQVKPRNYVSSANQSESVSSTQVESYCFTPDKLTLVTFEELIDANSHKDFRIQALKFWSRDTVQEGFQGFSVDWMLHDPCEDPESGVKLEAIDNQNIVIVNGSKIQVWGAASASAEKKKWGVKAEFKYQGLKVVQIVPDVRYRLGATKQGTVIRALVFLHENGVLSFWNQETIEFLYSFKLNSTSKKVVFESSMRYLASLTAEGSAEVWKIKGAQEKYWWDLSFRSVKDIINNPDKENQFIISMNSEDTKDADSDSILLFQYSRPQNLIMYWKSQLPFLKLHFCSDSSDSSYLLLVTKNLELQKIYFGVDRDDLKAIA